MGWQDQVIQLRFYLDGPISKEDHESMSCVATEVIVAFPEPWMIDEAIMRRDAPEPLECLEAWAYHRRE